MHPPSDRDLNKVEFPVVPILENNVNMCDCMTYKTKRQENQHGNFDFWEETIDVPVVEAKTDLMIDDKSEIIIFDIVEDIHN